MRKKSMGFIEMLVEIGAGSEYEAQVEAKGEARGKEEGQATKALEVAKNLITRIGLPLEQVAEATGLDLETVQSLASQVG
jgi:predicted transposase YdaD